MKKNDRKKKKMGKNDESREKEKAIESEIGNSQKLL